MRRPWPTGGLSCQINNKLETAETLYQIPRYYNVEYNKFIVSAAKTSTLDVCSVLFGVFSHLWIDQQKAEIT
jgi:hypothetical protein